MAFDQMLCFVENPIDDKGTIFSIGNFVRKFLEGYMHLKYMESEGFETHLAQLIPNDVDKNAVARFANSGSHLHSSGGVHGISASAEAARLIDIVLDAVKADDQRHYAALEAALDRTP